MYKNIIFILFIVFIFNQAHAQTTFGSELISHQKFGDGLMVVSSKIVPLSGTVSNMFFYNREDKPWEGNRWYEYDWEIRGKLPRNGWSQIRVRNHRGGPLRDAPENTRMDVNLGQKFYNYILIRRGDTLIYDIRYNFDHKTYDYMNPFKHGKNSRSVLTNGLRFYKTGKNVKNIPTNKRLDFNLGITGFNNNWAGKLPKGAFSRTFQIKYARFYQFKSSNSHKLKARPFWFDEFNGNHIDYSKWQVANWFSGNTQFRPENVSVSSGKLHLKINRGL